jgi:hypothetical protein
VKGPHRIPVIQSPWAPYAGMIAALTGAAPSLTRNACMGRHQLRSSGQSEAAYQGQRVPGLNRHQPAGEPGEDQIEQPQRHDSRSSRRRGVGHRRRPQARTDFWHLTGPGPGRPVHRPLRRGARRRRDRRCEDPSPQSPGKRARRAVRAHRPDGADRPDADLRPPRPDHPIPARPAQQITRRCILGGLLNEYQPAA